ncbi:MAG: FxLYD domain-containing protein [Wenzhouxiangellaceae bacterium]|nr:FxLYD domain-containing protein [Wenzhouxiangellaceae bacterium]
MKDWKRILTPAIGLVMLCACSGDSDDLPAGGAQTGPEAAEWTRVSRLNTYTDGYGSVIAIAMVENMLDSPLEAVEVAMILSAADGEELDRTGAQIALLPPGSASPVKVVFNDGDDTEWDTVEPLVWRARRPEDSAAYTELRLEDVTDGNDPASSYVHQASGTVRNVGEGNAGFVMIHAGFFNDQDELVAVAHGGAGGELAPGGEADFSVGTNTAADDIFRVELFPMARKMD